MAAKSKSQKRIYRKGAEKKAKKGFTKRYNKKKGEYVYGATPSPSYLEVSQSKMNFAATAINTNPNSRWSNTSFAVRDSLAPI